MLSGRALRASTITESVSGNAAWFPLSFARRILGIFHLYDLSGVGRLFDKLQRVAQDAFLQLSHAGPAHRVTDLKSHRMERAGRAHLARGVRADRDERRRDAAQLDFALDRNYRAVTYLGSASREDDYVGPRFFVDLFRDLWSRHLIHLLELHCIAHITDVLARHCSDESFLRQLAKRVEG